MHYNLELPIIQQGCRGEMRFIGVTEGEKPVGESPIMCKVVLWYEADTEWLTIEVDSDEDGDKSFFASPIKKTFGKLPTFYQQLAQMLWKI